MASHEEIVLSAILSPNNPRRDLLSTAVIRLEDAHFNQEIYRNIFKFLSRYFDRTGEVMPLHIFSKALEDGDVEAAKRLSYTETYKTLELTKNGEAEFKWSMDQLRDLAAKRETGVAITEAMEILERGYQVGKEVLKGHEDARNFLQARVHEIERRGAQEIVKEGDILHESQEIIADYLSRRDGDTGDGVKLGIPVIDDKTGGMYAGELILVAGSFASGKSMISTQAAWSATVEQGFNVFFATSETVRAQVIRRIIARHSRLPMFGKPDGLDSADLKRGLLSPADEKLLYDVIDDWENNSTYGKLHLIQVPREAKLAFVENRLREFRRENECRLVVVDYLALLKASVKRQSEREEFNEILKDAKHMAVDAAVPVMSPWQITREAQEAALKVGFFTTKVLSDTSEAEKSADQIMALLREPDNNKDLRLQWLKMRDDAMPPITELSIQLKSTYIGNAAGPTSFVPGSYNSDDLMAMVS